MSSPEPDRSSWKAPEVLVPFLGLLYAGVYLAYVVVPSLISSGFSNGFVAILVPFIVTFVVLAYSIWKGIRYGYLGSVIVSAFFIALEGTFIQGALGSPSDFSTFFGVVTVVPALIASLVYSILGLRVHWRKGAAATAKPSFLTSGALALVIVGFVIGALVVGVFAGATETRLLNLSGTEDIAIVTGAVNQGNANGYYSPASFNATVGTPVVWTNRDGAGHTVTSTTANSFDSGNIESGGTYQLTFNQTGTFNYFCTFHPWMTGTVVVKP